MRNLVLFFLRFHTKKVPIFKLLLEQLIKNILLIFVSFFTRIRKYYHT